MMTPVLSLPMTLSTFSYHSPSISRIIGNFQCIACRECCSEIEDINRDQRTEDGRWLMAEQGPICTPTFSFFPLLTAHHYSIHSTVISNHHTFSSVIIERCLGLSRVESRLEPVSELPVNKRDGDRDSDAFTARLFPRPGARSWHIVSYH